MKRIDYIIPLSASFALLGVAVFMMYFNVNSLAEKAALLIISWTSGWSAALGLATYIEGRKK